MVKISERRFGMEANTVQKEFNKSVRESVYEVLKGLIISGELAPGSRIKETEFAEKLHVSRTPLREALRKLEDDDLIESVVNKGVFVKAFTLEDIEEIYSIRNSLEMLTISSVIVNATEKDVQSLKKHLLHIDDLLKENNLSQVAIVAREFHNHIINLSGLNRVIAAIHDQDEYIDKFSFLSIHKETRRKEAREEHYQIVACIENKDEEGLRAVIQRHIQHSKMMCLLALKENNKLVSRKNTKL